MEKILIVEDEKNIIKFLEMELKYEGYDVTSKMDGREGLDEALENDFDLIILDIMLPSMDGIEICKNLKMEKDTPVIMLTARGEIKDKVEGLQIGADDYMTKPFSVRELVARVKAQLRRNSGARQERNIFNFGDVTVNLQTREVRKSGHAVDLTLKEFEILKILIKNKGSIITREVLLDRIWGYEYIGETRTVDVHIRHLRQKIEKDDKNPMFIQTIRGVGYKFLSE